MNCPCPAQAWLQNESNLSREDIAIIGAALKKHHINSIDVLIDLSDAEIRRDLPIQSAGTRKRFRFALRRLRESMTLPPEPQRSSCFGCLTRPIIIVRLGGGNADHETTNGTPAPSKVLPALAALPAQKSSASTGPATPQVVNRPVIKRGESKFARDIVTKSEESVMRRKSALQVKEEASQRRLKQRILKRKSEAIMGLKSWVQAYDPHHDTFYFYNKETMETSWDHPGGEEYHVSVHQQLMDDAEDHRMEIWRKRAAKKFSRKKLQSIISKVDKENHGGLNIEKFSTLMATLNSKNIKQDQQDGREVNVQRMLSRFFAKIAIHEDGTPSWLLTTEQFEKWLRPA